MSWSRHDLEKDLRIDYDKETGEISQIANQAMTIERLTEDRWFLSVGGKSFDVYSERHGKGTKLKIVEK